MIEIILGVLGILIGIFVWFVPARQLHRWLRSKRRNPRRTTPEQRSIRFVCNSRLAASAEEVYVAGTFNGWLNSHKGSIEPDASFQLKRVDHEGAITWEGDLQIPVGPHEFKFVIGESYWIHWHKRSGYLKGSDAPGGSNFRVFVT